MNLSTRTDFDVMGSTIKLNVHNMGPASIRMQGNVYPWTPTTHGKMKLLIPRNLGETTPKNDGKRGFPW